MNWRAGRVEVEATFFIVAYNLRLNGQQKSKNTSTDVEGLLVGFAG